ncbi:MAG: hypothetical protein WBV11_16420 [Salegentibacter sp.]
MKLLVIDSNGLSIIMGEDVSVVHPYCTKNKTAVSDEKLQHFSQIPITPEHSFTVNAFCPTQFDFEIFSWEMHFSETIGTQDTPFSSKLNSLYLENTSPPPRLG